VSKPQAVRNRPDATPDDRYKWVALANTTASIFMATLDGSIVIIALPAIFRGIHLDSLAAGNISYLLWMIMGYRLVQAVLVVTVGRMGDMFGRVRIYTPASSSLRSRPSCSRSTRSTAAAGRCG
jgi:MFS family permease